MNTYNKEKIAEGFGEFFSTIGMEVANKIKKPKQNYKAYLTEKLQNSIFLNPTNKYEIVKIIESLKNKNSSGYDKINNKLLKQIKMEISYPLEIIFNKSISEGIFPNKFKLAHVIPIYKNSKKSEMTNYRPISLLTCMSKILEKIIFDRLYSFIEKNNLFNNLQFGFRKKT